MTAKKALAALLVLVMLATCIPVTVSAASNHTQAEAVEWIKARGNEHWWQDVDGVYGCQCVDLVMKYYEYLVGYRVGGNAYQYATNALPAGWYRDNTASPGAIFVCPAYASNGVWTDTKGTGHVGLVYAVSGNTKYTVETNTGETSGGNDAYARYQQRNFNGNVCYIHPDFKASHTHSYSAAITKKATCTAAGTKTYTCSCGASYTETIPATGHKWNSGVVTVKATCTAAGTKTYTCANCHTTYKETVKALGHDYHATVVPATCTTDSYAKYTCSRCQSTYNDAAVTGWSAWSASVPPADAVQKESKTQYRAKTKSYTTGKESAISGWTANGSTWKAVKNGTNTYFARPYGFNTSSFSGYSSAALKASETATAKRTVSGASHKSYIYWHWVSPYCYGVAGNCYIGNTSTTYINSNYGTTTVWEAFESANDIRTYTNSDGSVRVPDHSKYSFNWFILEVYTQTYTDYEKQYSFYKWSDWSAWQDGAITASADRQVETRKVYRYKKGGQKATGHIYTDPYDTTCNVCGKTRTATAGSIIAKAGGKTTLINGDGAWWYVKNNAICKDATLVNYNKEWWYVQGGKVRFDATGLCQYGGLWYYVQGGKVRFDATGLCQYGKDWYYVQNGKVNFGASGLCKYGNDWWHVKNGKVVFDTTLVQYGKNWYYVQGGKVNFGASGFFKYGGAYYKIVNGVVVF